MTTNDLPVTAPTIEDYKAAYQQARDESQAASEAAAAERQATALRNFESDVRAWLGDALPLFGLGEFQARVSGRNCDLSVPVRVSGLDTQIETRVHDDQSGRYSARLIITNSLRLEMRTQSVPADEQKCHYLQVLQPLNAQTLGEFFIRIEEYKQDQIAYQRQAQYKAACQQMRDLYTEAEVQTMVESTSAALPEWGNQLTAWGLQVIASLHATAERDTQLAQARTEAEQKLAAALECRRAAWFPFRIYRITYTTYANEGDDYDGENKFFTEHFHSAHTEPSADGWWPKLASGTVIPARPSRLLLVEALDVRDPDSPIARETCAVESVWIGEERVAVVTPPPGVSRLDPTSD